MQATKSTSQAGERTQTIRETIKGGGCDRIDRITRDGVTFFEAFSGGSYIGKRDTLPETELFIANYLHSASAMERALDC